VGCGDRSGDRGMAAVAPLRHRAGGWRLPRRAGRLDGDLGGLGERRRPHLRGGRAGARLPGRVRAGADLLPAGECSDLARRPGARPRNRRRIGPLEPLRAVVRRGQGAGYIPALGRGETQLSGWLLERPRRDHGDRRRAAGLAGCPGPNRRHASGGRRGDPVADPGRLPGLLARRGGGRLDRARGAPGAGPGPDADGGEPRDWRGRRGVARLARNPQARVRRRPLQLDRGGPGRSDARLLHRGGAGGGGFALSGRRLASRPRGARALRASGRRDGCERGNRGGHHRRAL
jgi:hypothetical protein